MKVCRPIKAENWPTDDETAWVVGRWWYDRVSDRLCHMRAGGVKALTVPPLNGTFGNATLNSGNRRYMACHVVWLLCKGEWPRNTLTYKDGNRSNVAITNLVEVCGVTGKPARRYNPVRLPVVRTNGTTVQPLTEFTK